MAHIRRAISPFAARTAKARSRAAGTPRKTTCSRVREVPCACSSSSSSSGWSTCVVWAPTPPSSATCGTKAASDPPTTTSSLLARPRARLPRSIPARGSLRRALLVLAILAAPPWSWRCATRTSTCASTSSPSSFGRIPRPSPRRANPRRRRVRRTWWRCTTLPHHHRPRLDDDRRRGGDDRDGCEGMEEPRGEEEVGEAGRGRVACWSTANVPSELGMDTTDGTRRPRPRRRKKEEEPMVKGIPCSTRREPSRIPTPLPKRKEVRLPSNPCKTRTQNTHTAGCVSTGAVHALSNRTRVLHEPWNAEATVLSTYRPTMRAQDGSHDQGRNPNPNRPRAISRARVGLGRWAFIRRTPRFH
mmetsp:Transcript_4204/g.26653  ORF Transcript_4204/g.26653 Transcript_4204/m.26653 type:complete len:359 (-) Transcript_4204:1907-2983(-)